MARTYNELNELVRKAQKINQAQGETLVALANAVNGLEEGKVNVIDVENIKTLTDEQCNSLRCGDIVRKITDGQKHCYIVSFKKDEVGMCLTYADATVVETQSYDYTNSHWVYNSEDKNSLDPYELPVASADTLGGVKVGSGLEINNGILSALGSDTPLYSHHIQTSSIIGTNAKLTFDFITSSNEEINTTNKLRNVLSDYTGAVQVAGMFPILYDSTNSSIKFITYMIIDTNSRVEYKETISGVEQASVVVYSVQVFDTVKRIN